MTETRTHLSLVVSRPRVPGEVERRCERGVVVRPGDRREPLPVQIDQTMIRLATEAAARGLEFDQAAALLVERALVLQDAARLGVPCAAAHEALDSAVESPTRLAVPASTANYVRSLVARLPISGHREAAGVRQLALPVRLTARAAALDFAKVLDARDLDEAVRFEVASASCGRTMSEWAMFALAGATRRRGHARHATPAEPRANS